MMNQFAKSGENPLPPAAVPVHERRFLLRDLPGELPRSSPHWQYTDNYLTGTRLNLRFVRVPETNERRYLLRQKLTPDPNDLTRSSLSEIALTGDEHQKLLALENREVRFNRYFWLENGQQYAIDMYLGPLLNLFIAKSYAPDAVAPAFAAAEITNQEMFLGHRLASLTAPDIRSELACRAMTKASDGEG